MRQYLIILLAILLLVGCGGEKVEVLDEGAETTVDEPTGGAVVETEEIVVEEEEGDTPEEEEEEAEDEGEVISIKNMAFLPDEITIKKGTTVTWKHEDTYNSRDDIKHMIMVYYEKARSDHLFHGDEFSHTFNEPGEFPYIDIIYKTSMKGKVIVTE